MASVTLQPVETEIIVPNEVGVMTLPGVAFFPHALMPLHIFEPRYRQMLKDVLAADRIFAIAGLHPDSDPAEERGQRIATAGIVRACNLNEDGTSNLLLQGISRVECLNIVAEVPYRRIQIQALASERDQDEDRGLRLRKRVERLISLRRQLGAPTPDGFTQFLRSIDDPEAFVDLAVFTLCPSAALKQRLLETLAVEQRLQIYGDALRQEIDKLTLQKKLQGRLSDDDIERN